MTIKDQDGTTDDWDDEDRAMAMMDEEDEPIYCACSSCGCHQLVDAPGRCSMCAEACPPAGSWEEGL